jgi:hypothetical protein
LGGLPMRVGRRRNNQFVARLASMRPGRRTGRVDMLTPS